jgi:hypothetical protein
MELENNEIFGNPIIKPQIFKDKMNQDTMYHFNAEIIIR